MKFQIALDKFAADRVLSDRSGSSELKGTRRRASQRHLASTPGRFQRTMGGAYDEIDLEDMDWNSELGAFTYQCPCGDLFQITPEELRAGEEVGHCPSCSLVITVVYDPDELKELIPAGKRDESGRWVEAEE